MVMYRLMGATALATSLFLGSAAFAAPVGKPQAKPAPSQTAAPADDEEGDGKEILVTGSRIPRPETDGVLPGVQVSGVQVETRGFTNALEALNDIPLVGPGASPLTGNNGGQTASLGAAFVDLLDLGTARTLTLVNGRRFVSGNAASLFVDANATGSQVDVNVIPSSLISRIDVLTVGGAAAYGTDAIAGVVNYILKDNYKGLEFRALSGISDRGDSAQYQLNALAGTNFFDGRANVTISGEYTRNDGLQATSRDFRNARPGSYTNPFNGGVRNGGFNTLAYIDVTNTNNGAFLRNTDDGQPSSLFANGFVTQTLSNPGTVINLASNTLYTPYTPITSGAGATLRTSNYITFTNGIAPVGFALNARNVAGQRTTIASLNDGFYSTTAGQIIAGRPGADAISGNGLNGASTQALNVPFTTFAPTSLPTGVTAAQIFAAYGVTPPAGGTAAQQTLLAVNILQANRFTAREFLAANPNVNLNYFIGTFDPLVPRVANTDTTLVSVRVNGNNVMTPVNQVLPFRAVPLEFNPDGSLREIIFSGPVSGNRPLTIASSIGGNGGFNKSLQNTVLRTQQDRYVANMMAHFDLTDEVTLFTENTYANVLNRSLGNIAGAQNFQTNSQEAAALLVNYNNPYLTAQNRAVLTSVGIAPGNGTNNGNFLITRQNQDIFGANPYTNRQETFRIVGGLRSKFELLGKAWNAEISGNYGHSVQNTRSTGIADVEYQLALDAVDQGVALGGAANGNIVCRAQLFPGQYLGRTPIGTAENLTRRPGADGLPTEILTTPIITQGLIDSCKPLNPFGDGNMSAASKAYVISPSLFRNVSKQTFVQATFGGGLFDLPAGTLEFNAAGEFRRESLQFTTNDLNQLGRSRSAPSANTSAYTRTYEIGGELRIPLTGPDFLPFVGKLEFDPAVRVTQQNGAAATYRNLAGTVITPKAVGKASTIYSLAGIWQPIRDIQFRGNYTRSVRNPSIVELFLGGQPSFTSSADLCGPANINSGSVPTTRAANCRAAAIAGGFATDATSANTFLAGFVPSGTGLQGSFTGSTDLRPERGKSWTVGGAFTPRFIPGFSLAADYIDVLLQDTITPTGLGTALQTCYDSPTYPNSAAQIGTNTCGFFSRDANFQLANGFTLGFLNLGAIKIHAVNISGRYSVDVGSSGKFSLSANAYHLITYRTSSGGKFATGDSFESSGTFTRPKWETTLATRYEDGPFFGQVTWNVQTATRIFQSGLPATGEQFPYTRYPALQNVDITVGADINDRFRMQLNVKNVLDQTTAGDLGYRFADYYDQIGRRYTVAVTTKF